jgi:hypothetical protein
VGVGDQLEQLLAPRRRTDGEDYPRAGFAQHRGDVPSDAFLVGDARDQNGFARKL